MTATTTYMALVAALALALLSTMTEAHSWADCVDWRFNDPKKPGWSEKDGKCFGWARQFPANSKVRFGDLDSASPNRHYQQDPDDFTSCSNGKAGREPGADESRQNPISKAYGGRWGAMASARAGDEICVRWPAKNHAVKDEEDRGVFINMPPTVTTKDPSQSQLMKMNIAKLSYKNCSPIKGDTDHTPCGGCFKIPEDRKAGTYLIQWRWELNDDEWYTSCWDIKVTGKGEAPADGNPADGNPADGNPADGNPADGNHDKDKKKKDPIENAVNNSTLNGMTCVFADLANGKN